jgi:undecaprenyl phosphate N,N'-diacetylbacillosamine 1-phosphate transferase
MIILKIVLVIIAIAFVVGVIAGVADIWKKSTHKTYGPYERFFKRPLDAFLSTGAFIVLSPVLLITAILVKVKLGSPVLFTQDRPGKDEKIIRLYKFRSMTNQRDENGQLLPDDVRLTKFGRILRSTSLDELPELLNIIKGDMSVVGPRPLLIEYLPYYTEEEHHRHDVRPGLTGLAQVNGRNAISWDSKLAYDVEYVSKITFVGDAKIIKDTFIKTIKRSDIQVGSEFQAGKFIDQRKERLEKTNEKNS